jgi:hypothetical protein
MFSQGQLIFAGFFIVSFVVIMIISYRKDLKMHKFYYKGSLWILGIFMVFIGLLFLVKTLLKE